MAASLAVLVSAALGLGASGEGPGLAEAALAARGWLAVDQVGCPGLRAGGYYEIANEDTTAELFVLATTGGFLVSRLPLPEPPYDCREIPGPQFVEEIR